MINQGVLHEKAIASVIGTMSHLNPEGKKHRKGIAGDLLLTALIDAFSILVIFLLMSFSSTGEILYIGKGTELPKAANTTLIERFPVVKIDEGKLYLEDQLIEGKTLTAGLLELRKQYQETHPNEEYPGILTIQADRRVKYEVLNQIVVAASQAGFSDMKFATVIK